MLISLDEHGTECVAATIHQTIGQLCSLISQQQINIAATPKMGNESTRGKRAREYFAILLDLYTKSMTPT